MRCVHAGTTPLSRAWRISERSEHSQDTELNSGRLLRELGDKMYIVYSLEAMATLAAEQGQVERAARLWAVADVLLDAIGALMPPKEKDEVDRKIAEIRTSLGEQAFSVAWQQGRAMTIEQAIEYALQDEPQESNGRPAE